MPLSPTQAIKLLGDNDESEFERLCVDIDEFLVDALRRKAPVLAYGVGDLSASMIDRVITTYNAIGWSVKKTYDQRDGDFLAFGMP
jgi:hypothetical protein